MTQQGRFFLGFCLKSVWPDCPGLFQIAASVPTTAHIMSFNIYVSFLSVLEQDYVAREVVFAQ